MPLGRTYEGQSDPNYLTHTMKIAKILHSHTDQYWYRAILVLHMRTSVEATLFESNKLISVLSVLEMHVVNIQIECTNIIATM